MKKAIGTVANGMDNAADKTKHTCVLCNTVLPTKEELQVHFRKHANKEIDYRGQPMNKRFIVKPNPEIKPSKLPALPKPAPSAIPVKNDPPKKTPVIIKSSTVYGTKLKQVRLIHQPEVNLKDPLADKEPPVPVDKKVPKAIECDVCHMQFDTVTVAIQHKFRKHPNSSLKYYCKFCGMQFPLKYNQEAHLEKEHIGAIDKGEYPCDDCKVTFKTPEAHAYHIKSTHKRIVAFFKPIVTPPPSKKIKVNNAREAQSVYYCHLCGFEYIVKFNLQKHLERQHTAEERDSMPTSMMKCTTCDALFYNKKAYDNHNMYHRPDDLYVTSEEQRLQTVSRVDQDFDIRRVIQPVDKYMAKVRAFKRSGRPREVRKQPSFSSLSDSELSPASTPPTSDSEDEPELGKSNSRSSEATDEQRSAEIALPENGVIEIKEKDLELPKSKSPSPQPVTKKAKLKSQAEPIHQNTVRVTRSKTRS
ncbi:transcriptional repressor CTCF-like [Neocloeon triangulifer]|uniref:transcriptional repressor CTCF-like n=1 Tax=Neocloeon triangulifer TaxID=2078957 RepID=UPI00286F0249|nr:transcriptional repressor CTCF-like [Neocloeon triangulifer]